LQWFSNQLGDLIGWFLLAVACWGIVKAISNGRIFQLEFLVGLWPLVIGVGILKRQRWALWGLGFFGFFALASYIWAWPYQKLGFGIPALIGIAFICYFISQAAANKFSLSKTEKSARRIFTCVWRHLSCAFSCHHIVCLSTYVFGADALIWERGSQVVSSRCKSENYMKQFSVWTWFAIVVGLILGVGLVTVGPLGILAIPLYILPISYELNSHLFLSVCGVLSIYVGTFLLVSRFFPHLQSPPKHFISLSISLLVMAYIALILISRFDPDMLNLGAGHISH
jgi:hypothetical protein